MDATEARKYRYGVVSLRVSDHEDGHYEDFPCRDEFDNEPDYYNVNISKWCMVPSDLIAQVRWD